MVPCVSAIDLAAQVQIWQHMQQPCTIKVLDALWVHMLKRSAELGGFSKTKQQQDASNAAVGIYVRLLQTFIQQSHFESFGFMDV